MGFYYTLVLCAALAVVQSKVHWDKVQTYWDKCAAETGVEESFDEVVRNEKIPTSDKGMCLIECMLRSKSIYGADGQFNKDGTKKHFEELFEEQPDVVEKALNIAEECSKIDISGLDKCEAAAKHVACAKAKFAMVGRTVEAHIMVKKE